MQQADVLVQEARPAAHYKTTKAVLENLDFVEETAFAIKKKFEEIAKKKLSELLTLPDLVIDCIFDYMLATFDEKDWR